MTHDFGKDYWEEQWGRGAGSTAMEGNPPNPYLVDGISGLTPATALDAGCGAGAEAIWLASQGWQVTAADISSAALGSAARRAIAGGVAEQVSWVEADLTVWSPDAKFDLVTTHYAHPSMPQLAFYERVSHWVAPGGTLLIVGHLHSHAAGHGHQGHQPPAEASATVAGISAVLDNARWEIVTAEEQARMLTDPGGRTVELRDVVVQANRRT